jgi:Ca-activated chloride channel family protein
MPIGKAVHVRAFALVFSGAIALAAQASTPQPSKEKPASPSARRADRPGTPQFRAEVDQVVVYAAVYDKNGALVTDLGPNDFQVFEDKTPQDVTYFGLEDLPSTVGIVIDRSGSMKQKMDLVNEAIQLFLSLANPANELFLITFNDRTELEEGFTYDSEDIRDALENVIASGGTALYDAIFLALDEARKGSEPKKAVIVFTDGEDKDSYYKHEELLEKVQESDVQVHVVAFLSAELSSDGGFFGVFKSEKEKITKGIADIAEYSGGKALFPEQIEGLKPAFESIARELRSQYRLGYISSNKAKDGAWRAVDVRVENAKERGFKVRAKKGYLSPKG